MTEFLQLTFAGIALGATYALVALGFVVIYKATGVINFAQGGLLALGAYVALSLLRTGIPFYVVIPLAILAGALIGATVERIVLKRMVGQPPFSVIMITIGVLFVIEPLIVAIWSADQLNFANPWNIRTVQAGGVVMALRDLWTIGLTAAAILAFFAFFRLSSLGVAMRATAFDQEAAVAQGISARRIFAVSWAIAAGLGALAGITLAAGPAGLTPTVGFIALLAFPAMIVGGLDSPFGAVLGGVLIGLVQTWTAGYQDELFPWLGDGFDTVMPYVVMVIILLVRPFGLFGTPEVRRV